MKVYRYQDANQFYDRVKDYLLRDEALHNRLLRLCHGLIHNPESFEEKPLLATVEAEGDIVAVAMRTPPRNLLLSKIQDFGAIEAIAQNLHLTENSLAEVNAPNAEAKAFAETWRSLTSQSYEIKMALRAFQLKQIEKISQATGELRQATERDRQLLIDWFEAFVVEALGIARTNTERAVDRHLQRGTAYLWQDETPVSMACHVGITPNGAAISLVYTPPEHRGKGYASSCVAALSQTLLSRGHKYCFLFTDLANPTSNRIYQAIGYQSVGDLYDCSFFAG
ncbi:GNAT family N-acetyltransferase [Hassallia byssoidea VB512170]|uniref:GNAT family N-acetyltransferase n=1 Tax=Hassallia byssoidea VB512170 TaxID=1304833 RepID=A0A846H4L8_9CYAN|nr:GNAT family N-acetyltransferase [Hassalia byssoidea]NEU72312.1 GNAT family N-acetyltransferase [Hassalia byssoidea VB512170]